MQSSITFLALLSCLFYAAWLSGMAADSLQTSSCVETLKKYPQPDVTFAPKHVERNCPELCRNSSGHHSTGQFPHPWDCNLFINCHNDDAWVHFCQKGLQFNEKNSQCDWPANAKCKPGTALTPVVVGKVTATPLVRPSTTCLESDPKFNVVEELGDRPDLCTSGTGLYPAPHCRFYVRCNGTNAIIAKCTAGFVFNGPARRCDWPQQTGACAQLCGDSQTFPPDPPPPIVTKIEVHTVSPVTGPSRVLATTVRTTTTTTTTPKPTTPPTTEPPHDPLCKSAAGNFEYPNDCTKYVKCIKWHADLLSCPAGLVFIQEKSWCNWTWMLPETHKCYKAFDNGSGDCPFTRDSNETQIATVQASTGVPTVNSLSY